MTIDDDANSPLARLMTGNARFVKNEPRRIDYLSERDKLVDGQQPFAIVLGCSDSRVPLEIVFDQGPGELFVVRVAGNVVDAVTLGSIEYATEYLHSQLLLVLGHESCGAVSATAAGGRFSPGIDSIVERISPAVAAARRSHPGVEDIVPFAVGENVWLQIRSLLEQSSIIRDAVDKTALQIAGGVYRLASGRVELVCERFDASTIKSETANST